MSVLGQSPPSCRYVIEGRGEMSWHATSGCAQAVRDSAPTFLPVAIKPIREYPDGQGEPARVKLNVIAVNGLPVWSGGDPNQMVPPPDQGVVLTRLNRPSIMIDPFDEKRARAKGNEAEEIHLASHGLAFRPPIGEGPRVDWLNPCERLHDFA